MMRWFYILPQKISIHYGMIWHVYACVIFMHNFRKNQEYKQLFGLDKCIQSSTCPPTSDGNRPWYHWKRLLELLKQSETGTVKKLKIGT